MSRKVLAVTIRMAQARTAAPPPPRPAQPALLRLPLLIRPHASHLLSGRRCTARWSKTGYW